MKNKLGLALWSIYALGILGTFAGIGHSHWDFLATMSVTCLWLPSIVSVFARKKKDRWWICVCIILLAVITAFFDFTGETYKLLTGIFSSLTLSRNERERMSDLNTKIREYPSLSTP